MAQINHMIAPERLLFSASYVASLLATLYCSVVMHSYILTIISSVMQLVVGLADIACHVVCACAALGGHLKLLNVTRDHGCERNAET
jgi:hypothetical protein